jgi:drug/metabolite transporter (DMT)-like permease
VGFLCGALAAILFAGKGVLVRLAYSHGAEATSLLALRLAWSLPCFAAVAWWYARRAGALAPGDRLRLLGLGILGYHVATWFDFAGLTHIDAALERVVLFLYPTVVLGLGLWQRRQWPEARLIAALLATYGGIILTWGDRIRVGDPTQTGLGVAFVATSAVTFAVHLVFIEPLVRRIGGIRAMAVAMVGACITAILQAVLQAPERFFAPAPVVIGLSAALAVLGTVIPFFLASIAMQRLGAARTAILGTVGPVFTALFGWFLLGEVLGVAGWLGLAVTTAGATLVALAKR